MIKVLIADDNDKVRSALRAVLEEEGFDVTDVADGTQVMKALRAEARDLVLCDLFMPDKDGLETIQSIRREFPDVRIVAISGGGMSGGIDMLPAARRLGAAEVLHKPVTRNALLAALARVLDTP